MTSKIPYGPKTPLPPPPPPPGFTPREFLFPNKSNVYDGLVMTSGILLATFLIKLIKKDMAPQFTSKNAASLALVYNHPFGLFSRLGKKISIYPI